MASRILTQGVNIPRLAAYEQARRALRRECEPFALCATRSRTALVHQQKQKCHPFGWRSRILLILGTIQANYVPSAVDIVPKITIQKDHTSGWSFAIGVLFMLAKEGGAAVTGNLIHLGEDVLSLLIDRGTLGGVSGISILVVNILLNLVCYVKSAGNHSKNKKEKAGAELKGGGLRWCDGILQALILLHKALVLCLALYKVGINGILCLSGHGDLLTVDGKKLPTEGLVVVNGFFCIIDARSDYFGFS